MRGDFTYIGKFLLYERGVLPTILGSIDNIHVMQRSIIVAVHPSCFERRETWFAEDDSAHLKCIRALVTTLCASISRRSIACEDRALVYLKSILAVLRASRVSVRCRSSAAEEEASPS